MVPDWQSCMFIYYDDFTHVQPYTVTGLRDALRMFGFRDVESELFYQLPVVWKYNLSNSLGIVSIAEYAKEVAEAAGVALQFEADDSEASPFRRAVLDSRKLEALGWKPSFTLEAGIRSTVEIAKFLKNSSGRT